MKEHELKIWPQFFQAVVDEQKTFEVRKNDRGFSLDDQLWLREWDPNGKLYTGRECLVHVKYITELPCLPEFVGMSIVLVGGTYEFDAKHLEPIALTVPQGA